ncbi:hypothetical protein D9M68_453830 [compost metagenome]
MARLNLLEETRFEKLPVTVFNTPKAAAVSVVRRIANRIKEKQSEQKNAILGLATGATPITVRNLPFLNINRRKTGQYSLATIRASSGNVLKTVTGKWQGPMTNWGWPTTKQWRLL